jgi:hypothetical protein
MKHTSLLGPLVSYEDNQLFQKRPLESYLQHLIFFEAYKMAIN